MHAVAGIVNPSPRAIFYQLFVGMETNQGEIARPSVMRFNIGAEDSGFFSGNRNPGSAFSNVIIEEPSSVSFQILPPN